MPAVGDAPGFVPPRPLGLPVTRAWLVVEVATAPAFATKRASAANSTIGPKQRWDLTELPHDPAPAHGERERHRAEQQI